MARFALSDRDDHPRKSNHGAGHGYDQGRARDGRGLSSFAEANDLISNSPLDSWLSNVGHVHVQCDNAMCYGFPVSHVTAPSSPPAPVLVPWHKNFRLPLHGKVTGRFTTTAPNTIGLKLVAW